MPNYRRHRQPGGTYFFTANLLERQSHLLVTHIDLLRQSVKTALSRRPFHIDAWVVLPDHMHCLWTLPANDEDYSTRWKIIKTEFSKALPPTEFLSDVRHKKGERGIWQRRFWEHTIRDENDYAAHMDYVYINPLKHGLVQQVVDWPYSSFHRDVQRGIYPADWASSVIPMKTGEHLE